jgi:HTH-type transcriptional regulator/antitoxin HigA
MTLAEIDQTPKAWPAVAEPLHVPRNESDDEELGALLDSLVDEVGEEESPSPASLMEVVGVLIEKYEDEHAPELNA